MAMQQLRRNAQEMNVMITEPCAITCRTAPSFLRVGHLELHARRSRHSGENKELELIVRHALSREYASIDDPSQTLQSRTLVMSREFARRLSKLVADWVRVGYCQGNFNSDNCLLAGRTMDYGPFGFIEKFDPSWNMWSGGSEHYAFMNQTKAAHRNFFSFMRSVAVLFDEEGRQEAQEMVNAFEDVCKEAMDDMWRQKLGLLSWNSQTEKLLLDLLHLMHKSSADYTILWRQLSELPAHGLKAEASKSELLQPLRHAFYESLTPNLEDAWVKWLKQWLIEVQAQGHFGKDAAALMRRTSPKYVPREWMLVEAYEAAQSGDHDLVDVLQQLFSQPFDEQPAHEKRYYRKALPYVENIGGVGFMS